MHVKQYRKFLYINMVHIGLFVYRLFLAVVPNWFCPENPEVATTTQCYNYLL